MNVHTFLTPKPPPPLPQNWRDELSMPDRPAVSGMCPCFQLADIKTLRVYIYYNFVNELWYGEEVDEVVMFLGCRGLRKSCLCPQPQRFPLSLVFFFSLSPPFVPHPHDCLSATRFNSMLVLYKVRNGGLRYCFFCNESERCKKNCTYFKTLWAERNYFLLLVSPLVWLDICCICKNYKSTPELLYSIEIFSKRYSMRCSRSQAPMRLFLCIFDKVLGREGLLQQVTHLNNLKT